MVESMLPRRLGRPGPERMRRDRLRRVTRFRRQLVFPTVVLVCDDSSVRSQYSWQVSQSIRHPTDRRPVSRQRVNDGPTLREPTRKCQLYVRHAHVDHRVFRYTWSPPQRAPPPDSDAVASRERSRERGLEGKSCLGRHRGHSIGGGRAFGGAFHSDSVT
jgi:hypothetical protein